MDLTREHAARTDASAPFGAGNLIGSGAGVPFIRINAAGGEARVTGMPRGFVGHRLLLDDDSRPRGLFAEWSWDGTTLNARVDPLGFFTLFVYAKGSEIVLSPSILQLLAQDADPTPDHVALAVFHRIGFFVETDTPFRHIRTLPPGGRLTWRDGVLQVQGGAPAPQTRDDLTRAQAVEAFIELPRAAIRRFLQAWEGPVTLPLSGGRDSRHILLEMVHQGRKPDTCVTFHHGGQVLNSEVQAARAIAGRAGVHHTILGRPQMRLRNSLRAMFLTQLCSDEHAQMMPMHDFLRGSPSAVFDGIGGDILTNPDDAAAGFQARARRDDYEGIAIGMAEGHGSVLGRTGQRHHGGPGGVFSPGLETEAIGRIAAAIRMFRDAPDPYQAFWFWNRTRREISFTSTGVLGGAAMVYGPYLDPEFVDLGLALPWSVTCDQKLHDDAIALAFPEYSDIPYAEGFPGEPMRRNPLLRAARGMDMLYVALLAGGPAAVRDLGRVTPLRREASDLYRLHKAFVEGMNAQEARRLMALEQRLARAAPRDEAMVTNVHSGD